MIRVFDLKIARREFLAMSAAALVLPSQQAHSGEGGGAIDLGATAPSNPKPPKLYPSYTQAKFSRLHQNEIDLLFKNGARTKKGGPVIKVEGFSEPMVVRLVKMAHADRILTRRLIRDMGKLKNAKKRLARLNEEIVKITKRIANLEDALDRAREKDQQAVIEETEARLKAANEYRKHLFVWRKFPSEGYPK